MPSYYQDISHTGTMRGKVFLALFEFEKKPIRYLSTQMFNSVCLGTRPIFFNILLQLFRMFRTLQPVNFEGVQLWGEDKVQIICES